MTTMRCVRPMHRCPGCKALGETADMVEIATVSVAGSNEWWHGECWADALEQHPEWEVEYPCTACGGDGIEDDCVPCPTCDGEGRTD